MRELPSQPSLTRRRAGPHGRCVVWVRSWHCCRATRRQSGSPGHSAHGQGLPFVLACTTALAGQQRGDGPKVTVTQREGGRARTQSRLLDGES